MWTDSRGTTARRPRAVSSLFDFARKRILVVGASSGIGRQTAVTLSRLGAQVLLAARTEEKLLACLAELAGENHRYFVTDVSEPKQIEQLFRDIQADCGPLDGMVYAAGITGTLALNMLKPEKLQAVMNVNFFGFVECVRQFARKGRYSPGARIVGVSSVASRCGDKAHTAYSASKAAMDGAVRCLAMELAEKDIGINTIMPGMVKTEMLARFIDGRGAESEAVQKTLSRQYLGYGEPESIADAITFLLSPAAKFITGIALPADGGYTSC